LKHVSDQQFRALLALLNELADCLSKNMVAIDAPDRYLQAHLLIKRKKRMDAKLEREGLM
jgi:hypothetical protein